MWEYAASSAAALAASMAAKKQAVEISHQMHLAKLSIKYQEYALKTLTTPKKCVCCGSNEFRKHHEKLICSYCRSAL